MTNTDILKDAFPEVNKTPSRRLLSSRQEKYAFNIASGEYKTEIAAFLAAGYAKNKGSGTLAYSLHHHPAIIARINELRDKMLEPRILSVVERKVRLSEIAKEDVETKDGTLIRGPNIQAIAELNKMGGDYAPEKHQVDVRQISLIEVVIDHKG